MTHTITCTECLGLVATADVNELTADGAVREHCRTCADCANVVDEVAEESRRLADMLDGTLPGVPAHVLALRAVAGAAPRRRRARRLRSALIAVGGTAAALAAWALLRQPADAGSVEVRHVELQCLAPAQAAELARPYMPDEVRITSRPSVDLPILTLRGSHRDLATAEQLIARLDARWATERREYCTSVPGAVVPDGGAPDAAVPDAGAPAITPPAPPRSRR